MTEVNECGIRNAEVGRASVPAGFGLSRIPENGRHSGRPYFNCGIMILGIFLYSND
jgi:hypothetical protein